MYSSCGLELTVSMGKETTFMDLRKHSVGTDTLPVDMQPPPQASPRSVRMLEEAMHAGLAECRCNVISVNQGVARALT